MEDIEKYNHILKLQNAQKRIATDNLSGEKYSARQLRRHIIKIIQEDYLIQSVASSFCTSKKELNAHIEKYNVSTFEYRGKLYVERNAFFKALESEAR